MIELRLATEDEMILAFLQAEVDSPTERGGWVASALEHICAPRSQLIDGADLQSPEENDARRWVLGYARGYSLNVYLFSGFPRDVVWRKVEVTAAEVEHFEYANDIGWVEVSGPTRMVAEGVKNIARGNGGKKGGNVSGISARLRRGDTFPALIAAQVPGTPKVVLVEGHTRATSYVSTRLINDISVYIGTSEHMSRWAFY